MRERNFAWNLAFAGDEVIEGIEKMCRTESYPYTKEEAQEETHFCVTLPDGTALLRVRPLAPHQAPFNPILKFQRTLLTVSMSEVAQHTVDTLHWKLTLAFLRAGG